MSPFSLTEWLLLGAIASIGVLACLRLLAAEVHKEMKLHSIRIRAAHLRIAHIRAMSADDEPIGVDIIDDEPEAEEAEEVEASEVSDEAEAEEPMPAAA